MRGQIQIEYPCCAPYPANLHVILQPVTVRNRRYQLHGCTADRTGRKDKVGTINILDFFAKGNPERYGIRVGGLIGGGLPDNAGDGRGVQFGSIGRLGNGIKRCCRLDGADTGL